MVEERNTELANEEKAELAEPPVDIGPPPVHDHEAVPQEESAAEALAGEGGGEDRVKGVPLAESGTDEQVGEQSDEEEGADDGPAAKPLELIEESGEADSSDDKQWYILKVQVNREKSICDALTRRVKVAGLDDYFGEILIPTEDVREFTKTGKQRIIKRKLYPGYILVNMAISDDTWFLVRETPGIGDFTGAAGKPTPMEKHEVDRILRTMRPDEEESTPEKTNIRFKQGDRVRVKEGYFQNFEGEVETIDEANGRITVMINIFGRPTPVELDHWQFEDV